MNSKSHRLKNRKEVKLIAAIYDFKLGIGNGVEPGAQRMYMPASGSPQNVFQPNCHVLAPKLKPMNPLFINILQWPYAYSILSA
jgi:hypothetical protein